MKLEDLYLELGRAMTEKVVVGQQSEDKVARLQKEISALSSEMQSERDRTRNKQERIQQHVDELQEAIRLASEGTDPTLAKLTAKESLEERRENEKRAQKIGLNTTYGGYNASIPNSYTVPVNITGAAGGGGGWSNVTYHTYDPITGQTTTRGYPTK